MDAIKFWPSREGASPKSRRIIWTKFFPDIIAEIPITWSISFSAIRAFKQKFGVTQHTQHRPYSHNTFFLQMSQNESKSISEINIFLLIRLLYLLLASFHHPVFLKKQNFDILKTNQNLMKVNCFSISFAFFNYKNSL